MQVPAIKDLYNLNEFKKNPGLETNILYSALNNQNREIAEQAIYYLGLYGKGQDDIKALEDFMRDQIFDSKLYELARDAQKMIESR